MIINGTFAYVNKGHLSQSLPQPGGMTHVYNKQPVHVSAYLIVLVTAKLIPHNSSTNVSHNKAAHVSMGILTFKRGIFYIEHVLTPTAKKTPGQAPPIKKALTPRTDIAKSTVSSPTRTTTTPKTTTAKSSTTPKGFPKQAKPSTHQQAKTAAVKAAAASEKPALTKMDKLATKTEKPAVKTDNQEKEKAESKETITKGKCQMNMPSRFISICGKPVDLFYMVKLFYFSSFKINMKENKPLSSYVHCIRNQ